MVNRFECVLATVLHEEPPVVPQIIEFTNDMARSKFMPLMKKRVTSTKNDSKTTESATSEGTIAQFKRVLEEAKFLDNFIIGVGSGGFRVKNRLKADSERYEGLEESLKYVRDKGFFPSCSINRFFSGVWYFLRGPLSVILRDLYLNRRLFENLLAKVGEFNLWAEKNLLEQGAMMITWVDDLGYNKGTFMNPKFYEEFIFPWHKKAIDLAHRYGAFVNMHSHGNINAIVPLLVEAGLDVLNPIGPSDNMDLAILKEKFGARLCLQGGLSKHIGFMNVEKLRQHVADRLKTGSPGEGFILSSEGSLPYEMTRNNVLAFIKLSRQYRRNVPS